MTPLLGKAYSRGDNTGWYVVVDKSPTHVILVGVFHRITVAPWLRPKAGRWKEIGWKLTRAEFSRDFKRMSVRFHPLVQARFDRRMFWIWEKMDG